MWLSAFQKRSCSATGTRLSVRLAVVLGVALAAGAVRAGEFEFVVIGDTRPPFASQDFRLFEGLILDLSFPVPDGGADVMEPRDPNVNTFAYRVRYGNDSLVPVYFIELTLERKKE
jgi:hypothetical protein